MSNFCEFSSRFRVIRFSEQLLGICARGLPVLRLERVDACGTGADGVCELEKVEKLTELRGVHWAGFKHNDGHVGSSVRLQHPLERGLLHIGKRPAGQVAKTVVVLPVHLHIDLLPNRQRRTQKRFKDGILPAGNGPVERAEGGRELGMDGDEARALLAGVQPHALLPPVAEGGKGGVEGTEKLG